MQPVVEVVDLEKRYGKVVAVDGISFAVGHGEIFGIVGPDGAGKPTTVECLAGLREKDAGTVRVLGLDPLREPASTRATSSRKRMGASACGPCASVSRPLAVRYS